MFVCCKIKKLFMFILIVCIASIGIKFIHHEKEQNIRINRIKEEVELLKAERNIISHRWSENSYNYLAIGNSITLHGKNDYWFNECGMAASNLENDYIHQLIQMLESKNINVNGYAYNFFIWEVQSHDRAETLILLDKLLSKELNLVTVQLSENVSDISTFKIDFEELIKYIQNKAPYAKVIVIDDFWDEGAKSIAKKEVCEKNNIKFVKLDEIKNKKEYQAGLGTIVYDDKNNSHKIKHKGVATPPNDVGMKYIAEKIMEIIE